MLDDYQIRWFVWKRYSNVISYYANMKDGRSITHKGDIDLTSFDVSHTESKLFITTVDASKKGSKASRIWDLGAVSNLQGSSRIQPVCVHAAPVPQPPCAVVNETLTASKRAVVLPARLPLLTTFSRQSLFLSSTLWVAFQAQAQLWENALLWKKQHPDETAPEADAGAGDAKAKKLPPARPKPPPARPPPPKAKVR